MNKWIHYSGELTQPAKFRTKNLKISSCECTSNPLKGSIRGWAPGPMLESQKGTEAWLRHSLTPTLTFSWFLHLENVNGGDSKSVQLCEVIYVNI